MKEFKFVIHNKRSYMRLDTFFNTDIAGFGSRSTKGFRVAPFLSGLLVLP